MAAPVAMAVPFESLRLSLSRAQVLPALRAVGWVLVAFAAGVWLARAIEPEARALLGAHQALGAAAFVATSVLAVLVPVMSNLPLVPLAVLAFGPAATAAMLLAGWLVGSALSFLLGRHARASLLERWPSLERHADIDRLVVAEHRVLSLVLLRMTFPVDVLSLALGLFSPRTTLGQTLLSTLFGAAPFALLFAWFPVLPPVWQALVFGGSAAAFVAWAAWMSRRARDAETTRR